MDPEKPADLDLQCFQKLMNLSSAGQGLKPQNKVNFINFKHSKNSINILKYQTQ